MPAAQRAGDLRDRHPFRLPGPACPSVISWPNLPTRVLYPRLASVKAIDFDRYFALRNIFAKLRLESAAVSVSCYKEAFGGYLPGVGKERGSPNWGRMGQVGDDRCRASSRPRQSLGGQGGFRRRLIGIGLCFRCLTLDLSPAALTSGPTLSNATAGHFIRGSIRIALVARHQFDLYPPRAGAGAGRSDFDAEFGHIEGALGWQLREGQVGQPMPANPSPSRAASAAGSVPLPDPVRSKPVA